MKIGTLRLIGAWHSWRGAVHHARKLKAESLATYHLSMANGIAAEYSRRVTNPAAAKDQADAAIEFARKDVSKGAPR